MKTLISIVGATAIGKTKLAIDFGNHFDTEILSCDSRQFFREMKIGTAAPTEEELAQAKHHFIGSRSVTQPYSVGQYEVDALECLEKIFKTKEVGILVGGSMMYEKAVIEGLNNLPKSNEENQKKLEEIWEKQGYEVLQNILKEADPDYFSIVDIHNPRRLLRAIDVIWQTGQPYSALIAEPTNERTFKVIRIGISAPREIIYERINLRVEKMMQLGLLIEAKELLPYRDLVPLQTVGYTEIFKYLDGVWDLKTAVSEIQKNSRRFAKRQLTWYRKEENILWVDHENSTEEALSLLKSM